MRSLSLALLVATSSVAHAQCMTLHSLAASTSTRALAMGDANVGGRDDDVIFYNPAQLAVARGVSTAIERYGRQRGGGTMAATGRLGSGGFGIGASFATARDVLPCGTDTPPYDLPPVSGHRLTAVAGVSRSWMSTRFGIAARYVEDQYGSHAASRTTLDLGIGRDFRVLDVGSLTLAGALQNVGDRSEEAGTSTPLTASLGASAGGPVGPLDVSLMGQVGQIWWSRRIHSWSRALRAGGGIEAAYSWLDGYSVALRGGIRRSDDADPFGFGTWTGGAGLVLDRVAIDYAFEQLDWPTHALAHRIGVRVR